MRYRNSFFLPLIAALFVIVNYIGRGQFEENTND